MKNRKPDFKNGFPRNIFDVLEVRILVFVPRTGERNRGASPSPVGGVATAPLAASPKPLQRERGALFEHAHTAVEEGVPVAWAPTTGMGTVC